MKADAHATHGPGFQRHLRKEVTKDLRRKDREQLAKLREKIRGAKDAKRERMHGVTLACRVARVTNREAAAIARQKLRDDIAQARREAKGQCHANRDRERDATRAMVGASKQELHQARTDIRARHRAEGTRRLEKLTAREAKQESDDEVKRNLPRELVAVWRRVKASIHAGPRRSRTEAFLEWVHDHSAAVDRIVNEDHESNLEDLIRQERELERSIRRGEKYKRTTPELVHHNGGVPF